jgi:hypothetical protein
VSHPVRVPLPAVCTLAGRLNRLNDVQRGGHRGLTFDVNRRASHRRQRRYPQKICTSRRSWTNSIAFWNSKFRRDPPRVPADAGMDAVAWRPATHWRVIDRQLWRWPAALYAAGRSCRAQGHDPGQTGSPPRCKNEDLDAQNAAHAAFTGQRTVTSRSRDGMIKSLRVLVPCRKTAVAARRVAL